jgi:hypothetical protein
MLRPLHQPRLVGCCIDEEHIRTVLQEALKALEKNGAQAAAASVEAPR